MQGAILTSGMHNYYLSAIYYLFSVSLPAPVLFWSQLVMPSCDILGNAGYIIFTSVLLVYASLSVNFIAACFSRKLWFAKLKPYLLFFKDVSILIIEKLLALSRQIAWRAWGMLRGSVAVYCGVPAEFWDVSACWGCWVKIELCLLTRCKTCSPSGIWWSKPGAYGSLCCTSLMLLV